LAQHATKKCYVVYLRRWIVLQWGDYELGNVKTIEVESWLHRLHLAKSSCAKICNLMSVLFNHACRYELFDHNPIRLVRQGSKRRTPPIVLTPVEIKEPPVGLSGTNKSRNPKICHLDRSEAQWRDLQLAIGRTTTNSGAPGSRS
jgi:hypothetical protein